MLPFDYRNALVITMAGIVICLSFVVITGYVGQVSLAQVALAGAAGFTVSHFATDLGIDFPIGAIAGIAVATILGFITGVSALRVRGVSLAVVTLAAAVAIEQFGFASNTFGAGSTGSPVPEPVLFGFDFGSRNGFRGLDGSIPSPVLGFCILAVVVLTGLFVARLRISGLGQRMLAVRSNERAAAAAGVSVRNTKFAAFGISSFIAGVGGVIYAYTLGSVSADRFGILIALGFVAFAYVGGITMVSGAVFGGLIASEGLFSHFTQDVIGISGTWTLLIGGVTLILNLVFFPDGVAGSQYQKKKAKAAEKARQQLAAAEASSGGGVGRLGGRERPAMSTLLETGGLSVRFGGVHALSDVDLKVEEGQLVGLIGPNGAGKTTFIDAISGFVPSTGSVVLEGTDITGMAPADRAHRGLTRTWQAAELFDDLTVRENLMVAARRASWRDTLRDIFRGTNDEDERVDVGADAPAARRPRRRTPERAHAGSAQAGRRGARAGGAAARGLPRRARGGPGHLARARSSAGDCGRSSTAGPRCCSSTTTWGSCSRSATRSSCSSSARSSRRARRTS